MYKPLKPRNVDVSKIGFSEGIKGSYSDKRFFINYDNNPFILEFPPLDQSQYGPPSDKFDEGAKFDLRVPLDKTNDANGKIQQLENDLDRIDNYLASAVVREKLFEQKLYKKGQGRYYPIIKRSNPDDDDDDTDSDDKKVYHPSFKGKFKIKNKGSILNEKLFKEGVHRDEYFLEENVCMIYKNDECISNNKKIKDIKAILNKELYQSKITLLVEINNIWVGNIQGKPSYKVNLNFLVVKYEPTLMSNKSINITGYKFEKSDDDESDNEEKVDSKELDNNKIDTEESDDEINEKLEEQHLDSDSEEEKVVEKKSKKGRKKKESVVTK
jgi:hypothetical protein